jgi:hypothetical protein
MFSLFDLGDYASLCTAALEPLQSIFQGFAFLDANFRHRFPSLRRSRLFQAAFRANQVSLIIIDIFLRNVKNYFVPTISRTII